PRTNGRALQHRSPLTPTSPFETEIGITRSCTVARACRSCRISCSSRTCRKRSKTTEWLAHAGYVLTRDAPTLMANVGVVLVLRRMTSARPRSAARAAVVGSQSAAAQVGSHQLQQRQQPRTRVQVLEQVLRAGKVEVLRNLRQRNACTQRARRGACTAA